MFKACLCINRSFWPVQAVAEPLRVAGQAGPPPCCVAHPALPPQQPAPQPQQGAQVVAIACWRLPGTFKGFGLVLGLRRAHCMFKGFVCTANAPECEWRISWCWYMVV